ncbi:MAG: sigma-54-dependent Fis family transcriptional regulator [Alphaproteobacteria bacterium]|nr:sigma-54-dependent Fis family transcriptional regulator [Alphaproteobacteria bacterium]MCB9695787.1 sigma-54-dependent Fis family transcriptional regulator [Alphaproteobacteria bacterium]
MPAIRSSAPADLPRLRGTSPAMEQLRKRLAQVAKTPLPVLISGETGTGKEAVARSIHELSGRTGPFIPVDCAALSMQLVETELFGHERGAFTGANQRREGLVHAARGGTFFLDEVGELPMETQTRLLRLLEAGTYRPVGDQGERRADIRVLAATWRDLRKGITEGRFREDLYHRLSIVELRVPPLRERVEDVDELFEHFVVESCAQAGRAPPALEPAVRVHLRRWPWPGNVRELRNVAQYVGAMTPGARVTMNDLPPGLMRPPPELPDTALPMVFPASEIRIDLPYMEARRLFLDDFQQRYVEAVLAAHDNNVSGAARAAGMDRRSIQRIQKRARTGGREP